MAGAVMADSGPEIRADSQWMTYEEAGRRLGIGPESVARYARRERWPRQPGNDGKARVAIPPDFIPESAPEKRRADKVTDSAPDKNLTELLRTQIERERIRADKAEAEAQAIREEREADRIRAATAEAQAGELRAERDTARTEAVRLRAELEEARIATWEGAATLREEREEARIRAARLEGELEALRRPWWRRWLG